MPAGVWPGARSAGQSQLPPPQWLSVPSARREGPLVSNLLTSVPARWRAWPIALEPCHPQGTRLLGFLRDQWPPGPLGTGVGVRDTASHRWLSGSPDVFKFKKWCSVQRMGRFSVCLEELGYAELLPRSSVSKEHVACELRCAVSINDTLDFRLGVKRGCAVLRTAVNGVVVLGVCGRNQSISLECFHEFLFTF